MGATPIPEFPNVGFVLIVLLVLAATQVITKRRRQKTGEK
jgi:hypothetical protein